MIKLEEGDRVKVTFEGEVTDVDSYDGSVTIVEKDSDNELYITKKHTKIQLERVEPEWNVGDVVQVNGENYIVWAAYGSDLSIVGMNEGGGSSVANFKRKYPSVRRVLKAGAVK